jgi:hypothetical protein
MVQEMVMACISVTLVVVVLWSAIGHAQASISAAEAKDHVGEKATICGEVMSTHYAARSRGNPTFGTETEAFDFRPVKEGIIHEKPSTAPEGD